MVAPVRFPATSSAVGSSSIAHDGHKIIYHDTHGLLWLLHSRRESELERSPVFLAENGWAGGDATVVLTEQETVNRFGARVVGQKYPPFDGALDVVVRGMGKPLSTVWRQWRRGWSHSNPGVLQVISPEGEMFSTSVALRGFSDVTSDVSMESLVEERVEWRSLDGAWRGQVKEFTGDAEVPSDGDLPPLVKVRWDSASTSSMTLPDGRTVQLPSHPNGGVMTVNLDRGLMGHVTDSDGQTVSELWSQLRGTVFGVEIEPNSVTRWKVGPGATLEVSSRYTSPWRW
ncbi:hypothetical protein [Corynebacterium ulceribovis]|uniref:hypothetical protein n=1 Tax=Corynebacterium ulceribovis TaxID=487732 RepID=UPI0003657855|nr:hypothetical protein [Corynebacterium ulceribovis]